MNQISNSKTSIMFPNLLGWVIAFYALSLPLSMAAMELLSWLAFTIFFVTSVFWCIKKNTFLPPLKLTGFEWPLVGYWLSVVIAVLVINDLSTEEVKHAMGHPRWIVLFLFLCSLAISQRKDQTFLWLKFLVVGGLVASAYGVVQSQTGMDLFRSVKFNATQFGSSYMWRSKGFFSNAMTFANSMGLISTFFFGFFYLGSGFNSKHWNLIGKVATAFAFVAVITSVTRGVWLGVMVAILTVTTIKSKKMGIVALGIFILISVGLYSGSEVARTRINNAVVIKHDSVSERLALWKAHWAMFKDSPVWGKGLSARSEIQDYHLKVNSRTGMKTHAHNNILEVLSGSGILGFFFLSWFILSLGMISIEGIKKVTRTSDYVLTEGVSYGFLAMLICFHVSGLTEANFFDGEVLHMFLFLSVISISLIKGKGIDGEFFSQLFGRLSFLKGKLRYD